MTLEEKIIATAFTGVNFLDDFSSFTEAVESKLGRPVFTHELPSLSEEIKEVFREDFINMLDN